MTTRHRGLLLALATACISGVSIYVNSFAVKEVADATVYTTAKNLVAALVLGLVVLVARPMGARITPPATRTGRLGLAVVGIVGGSVPFVLFFEGLARAQAPGAAFLHKTLVLWVAVLALAVLKERLTALHWIAIGLLLLGQWWLGGRGDLPVNAGTAMILAATLLWALETILAKRLLAEISSWTVALARMGGGSVVLLAWLAGTGRLGDLGGVGVAAWQWILLTGVLLAAYVATWFAALARAQAVDVTAVLVLGALVTALIDASVAGLSLGDVPGYAGLALGVVLVAITMLRRPVPDSLAQGS